MSFLNHFSIQNKCINFEPPKKGKKTLINETISANCRLIFFRTKKACGNTWSESS